MKTRTPTRLRSATTARTQSQRAEQGLYDHYIQLLLDAGEAYEDDGAVRLKMGGTAAISRSPTPSMATSKSRPKTTKTS